MLFSFDMYDYDHVCIVFDWVLHSFWLDRRDEKMKMIEDDSF